MKQLRNLHIFFFSLLVLSFIFGNVVAQDTEKETNLKAVFLYNFTKYIDWQNAGNGRNFIIGVLGKSQIVTPLNLIAKTSSVEGKKIVILNFMKPDDMPHCDLLFISRTAGSSISSVVNQTGRGTLIVSEEPAGSSSGAALNLVLNDDKLRFEASLKAINSSGLKVSAQLMKLAILID